MRVQPDFGYKLEQLRIQHVFTRTRVRMPFLWGLLPSDGQEEPRTSSCTDAGVKQKGKRETAMAIRRGTFTGGDGDPMVPV